MLSPRRELRENLERSGNCNLEIPKAGFVASFVMKDAAPVGQLEIGGLAGARDQLRARAIELMQCNATSELEVQQFHGTEQHCARLPGALRPNRELLGGGARGRHERDRRGSGTHLRPRRRCARGWRLRKLRGKECGQGCKVQCRISVAG